MAQLPEKLFSDSPDGATWKDRALAEDLEEMHSTRDELDRRDDQPGHPRQTTARLRLETSGVSQRKASKIVNAQMAQEVMEKASQARAEQAAAEEAERIRQRHEAFREIASDGKNSSDSEAA